MGPLVVLGLLVCVRLCGGSGELRLVGGGGRCAGRVEVKHGGEWGSVCVLGRDGEARWAAVVCRQLGCGRVARASSSAPFGQGSGRIWLQPFCNGTEDALWNCPHFGWGRHFCGHKRDVGVTCTDAVELRLVGGGNPCAGRVEVKLQGHWGSVADDNWNLEDAEVVCQQLGCGSASAASSAFERFGVGAGLVSLALVDCSGAEATLWDCEIRGWGPYNSSIHDLDTAVVCQGFSRLVGGDGGCAGRLEVRQGRAWVGVCEDQVDMKVAQVVCRELGCGEVIAIPGSGRFGAVSGSLWDGGFQCNGTEPLLSACARRPPRSQDCPGPASVICSSYTGFRLGNGSSGCSGRVEVAVRGTWGSVCASEWDLPDAHVLCRHLGCGRAFSVPPGGSFGSGEGPLRPDAFGCSGSERHPGECPVAVLGKPPCAPGNAAAVNCSGSLQVRLVGSSGRCAGRVEVYSGGSWSSVCQEGWELQDAAVVCRQLGCGTAREAPGWPRFGAGTGPLWPYSPKCSGSEESLRECGRTERRECGSGGGAGAVCSGFSRLVGGDGGCAGRLEVRQGRAWVGVCEDQVDMKVAQVVCRELGCGEVIAIPGSGRFGAVSGSLWDGGFQCNGTEPLLSACARRPPRSQDCPGPASVICSCSLHVRLVGSSGRCAGRVEVYSGGSWSSVCQEGWELQDAAVVCRQLGCGTAREAPGWPHFGAGTGRLWPYSPECSGSEESLRECGRTERRECGSGGGAGAVCSGSGELRLVGGGGRCAGRVEVKHGGAWGSVCVLGRDGEARWAAVVCRQLGCGRVARASSSAPFGQGSGRIWLQPFCRGTEDALKDCSHFGWGWHFCGHKRDVGVTCTDAVELRLVGGGNSCAGRVEVKLQGHWGSVADDNWNLEDAEVVCQQLGCGSASAASSAFERFGVGAGLVSLALVDCSGAEATLWDCEIRGWGPYNSSIHGLDTAVVCQGFSQLVGGDGGCAGRLEVRQGRAWVGVCEDQVDMKVAQVVCRELGCGEVIAIPGSGRFGAVSGSLWDGGFQCNGTEPLLSACARRPPQSQDCPGPASVICSSYTGFRLGNGSSGCSGRVEVAVRGTWGSVCASEWDLPDAHVLCRHLGCGRAFNVPPGGSFGSGEGPLRPDAFGCSGSERHPGECPVAVLGKPPCAPGNAAAVNCSDSVESLRLVKGETRCEGWLEFAISTGDWRRVPGEVSLLRNLSNVCLELGCGGLEKSHGVPGKSYLLQINKTESEILQMVIKAIKRLTTDLATRNIDEYYFWFDYRYMTTAPADIPHGAYIVCSGGLHVRLVGSSRRCAGRVEVYSGGSWSSVCQEGWELQDAAVVCRELGCGTAREAPGWPRFGAGTGPLWPYSPECSGSEESLWECGRTERRECGSGGGAGAVCSGSGELRLVGGGGRCAGRVEVKHGGEWGSVCVLGRDGEARWAAVVCRQLGCGRVARASSSAPFGQGSGRIWLQPFCRGTEDALWSCPHYGWGWHFCGHKRDVGVTCTDAVELRLVDGGNPCAGRVEVKLQGHWGSVADDNWNLEDAEVVCQQLGCGSASAAYSAFERFGIGAGLVSLALGSGRIWLQPFCNGTEDALWNCPHFGWGRHFCGHERDVGVTCTDAVELRLVGGGNPCAGRVEVKLQGHWGSVADDNWNLEDAEVVCQQLGCGSASAASSAFERFGVGAGLVSLALVDCSGAEATLWDCEIRGWGPYNSSIHDLDTAVVCQGFSQLVGGDGGCAGRLEVRQGRAWVGVCEDQVDMKVAQVVCRELGCGEVIAIPGSGRFGAVSGSLWDGGFQCNGTEPLLSACARRPPRSQDCPGPASVICSSYTGFRLGNGSSGCSGRVEVAVRGTWGSVCASEWDLPDAHVLCRHLGCGRAFSVPPGGSFGSGEGPLRPDAFGCSGSERHPGECPVAVLGKPPCAPGNAAAVNCSGSLQVRLVGSSGRCAGRVEVYSGGSWSSVCQEGWELQDAAVVCRQLGCGTAREAPGWPRFGAGTGPLWPGRIWLQPFCRGTEDALWSCPHYGWGWHFCGHKRDVGVTCTEQLSVRLAGGPGRCAGILEVSYNGTWGRVCANGTSPDTATTVCRQLGCGHRGWLSAVPTQETTETWLAWVGCEDGARSLWQCPSAPWHLQSCGTDGHIHVECSLQVRLVGSSGRCAGRVEVYSGGSWSSVCQEGWELQDAAVVCRQLGCGTAREAPGWPRFGAGTGPLWPGRIWLQPFCNGTEDALWNCPHFGWGRHFCGHERDVGVTCTEQLSVRLAGGPGRCRGFLEMFQNSTWSRVCANGTSNGTAATVCRQLGCGHRGRLSAVHTQELTHAWLAWVGCEDGARSLWQCPSAPWHLQSCGTDGHVHVECEEDSGGPTEGHTTPNPEGGTSPGVPKKTPLAVAVGTVPVPTVVCVVLGTLLCLSLGALALLLCRARAWQRGAGRAADAISNAVYEELDYKAMPEYQEVPTPPGSLLEGWVKKLPYYSGDSMEGSDTKAAPDPPAQPEQGPPDGYDDVLEVPQEPPAASTGDISEGVARQRWISVLPTGGIYSPPSPAGATRDPLEQLPGHMDYDDVGSSTLGTLP
ncbi:unnamed protein product [Coccothraustes coccothraustes]